MALGVILLVRVMVVSLRKGKDMLYFVCSLRDEVSENFESVSLEVSEATAIRNFVSALRISQERKNGLLYSNPSDFSLYVVGSFDSTNGNLTPSVPKLLRRGFVVDGDGE